MLSVTSPHSAACQEAIAHQSLPVDRYSGVCETEDQLRQLWEIDRIAYGDLSLSFEQFRAWWDLYPYGSRNLFVSDQVVASLGLYPMPPDLMSLFAAGRIPESDLRPAALATVALDGHSTWYWSGLVITPSWQGRGLIASLLRTGVGSWSSSGHLKFPLSLYALGQTAEGVDLLNLFGFSKVKPAHEMPDKCGLYATQFDSLSQLRSRLRIRSV